MPLLVLTADRPPELRDVGAGQSIDQLDLYGRAAKWFVEVGTHEPGRGDRRAPPRAGLPGGGHRRRRAAGPGAPQLPAPRAARPGAPRTLDAGGLGGPPRRSPWTELTGPPARPTPATSATAGRRHARRDRLRRGAPSRWRSRWRGWPPRWAGRCSPTRPRACAAARTTARTWWPTTTCCCVPRPSPPRTGPSWCCASASRPCRSPCAPGSPAPSRSWSTRMRPGTTRHARRRWWWPRPPGPLLEALAAERGRHGPRLARLLARADALVPPALAAMPEAFEGRVPQPSSRRCPDDALLWLSYSMPIRDVEAFFPSSPKPLRFLAGRGANGIDGVVSSAAGAALGSGRPTFVLTGDVALRPRRGRPARGAPRRRGPHRGVREQRRRRDLRLPPGGGRRRPRDLRAPHRHPARRGPGALAAARRARAPPGRRRRASFAAAVAHSGPRGGAHRPRRQRRPARATWCGGWPTSL